ncbi:MAG: RND transporter [Desulfuromonas sp.]|nr:MAG: RND transporter [Desulfuromonas sp.]
MKLLQVFPYPILIAATLILGLAPFFPQPHLFEKIRMLLSGTLTRPVDIFDLLMHGSPALLLFLKWVVEKSSTT